jgi:hypothetical protein
MAGFRVASDFLLDTEHQRKVGLARDFLAKLEPLQEPIVTTTASDFGPSAPFELTAAICSTRRPANNAGSGAEQSKAVSVEPLWQAGALSSERTSSM